MLRNRVGAVRNRPIAASDSLRVVASYCIGSTPQGAFGLRAPLPGGERRRLALAYLCARLGERLALGQIQSLESYSPCDDDAVDMHHLRACLAHPVLARLDEALHTPELLRTLAQMRSPAAAD